MVQPEEREKETVKKNGKEMNTKAKFDRGKSVHHNAADLLELNCGSSCNTNQSFLTSHSLMIMGKEGTHERARGVTQLHLPYITLQIIT